MYLILGDIIAESKNYEVIVHGCNCMHTMGAGVAKAIKEAFPEAYEADLRTVYSDPGKLGSLSVVNYPNLTIVNAYTQYDYKDSQTKINVDYKAIESSMALVKKRFSGKRILMPMIGSGLGGGKWSEIKPKIEWELRGENVTIITNNEDVFYDEITTNAIKFHDKHIENYKRGAHNIIGIFVGHAMKESKGTADPSTLLKKVYDKLRTL